MVIYLVCKQSNYTLSDLVNLKIFQMEDEQEVIENQQHQRSSVPMVVEPVVEQIPVPK